MCQREGGAEPPFREHVRLDRGEAGRDECREVAVAAMFPNEFRGAPQPAGRRRRDRQGTQGAEQRTAETVEVGQDGEQRVGDRRAVVRVGDRGDARRAAVFAGGEDVIARHERRSGLVHGGDQAGLEHAERGRHDRRRRGTERGRTTPHVAGEEIDAERVETRTGLR